MRRPAGFAQRGRVWTLPEKKNRGMIKKVSVCTHRRKQERKRKMKIAVTYESGMVFPHFGHAQAFKVYDVQDGEIKAAQVAPTQGSGHGALRRRAFACFPAFRARRMRRCRRCLPAPWPMTRIRFAHTTTAATKRATPVRTVGKTAASTAAAVHEARWPGRRGHRGSAGILHEIYNRIHT